MDKHVNVLREVLSYLHDLTPAEYADLQDFEWDALQDLQEVCQRISGRIDALEVAAPLVSESVPVEPTDGRDEPSSEN